jgi:hypothetical protein
MARPRLAPAGHGTRRVAMAPRRGLRAVPRRRRSTGHRGSQVDEQGALERWHEFLATGLESYGVGRDRPDLTATRRPQPSRRGGPGGRAIPWWAPGCASSCPRDGCTTGCGWSRRASSSRICTCGGPTVRGTSWPTCGTAMWRRTATAGSGSLGRVPMRPRARPRRGAGRGPPALRGRARLSRPGGVRLRPPARATQRRERDAGRGRLGP